MAKAYHFSCRQCSFSYTGPIGHKHAARDQVISVICPSCQVVEARRLNWTQIPPEAKPISDNLEEIVMNHEISGTQKTDHHKMEKMIRAVDKNIEWHDYSLYVEDVFKCWSCEEEMFLWDTAVCPCCGDKLQREFGIDMD